MIMQSPILSNCMQGSVHAVQVAVASASSLKSLSLQDCSIDCEGLEQLAGVVSHLDHLELLDLSRNQLAEHFKQDNTGTWPRCAAAISAGHVDGMNRI